MALMHTAERVQQTDARHRYSSGTAKENKDAATCSPQIPQGAKGQHGVATRGASAAFGDFGLKCTDRGRLTARQIEAARRAISSRQAWRLYLIRVFPDKPISTKPAEVRMGNGKGNPEYYVAEIQPGKIVFEIVGLPEELAREVPAWLPLLPLAPRSSAVTLVAVIQENKQ